MKPLAISMSLSSAKARRPGRYYGEESLLAMELQGGLHAPSETVSMDLGHGVLAKINVRGL